MGGRLLAAFEAFAARADGGGTGRGRGRRGGGWERGRRKTEDGVMAKMVPGALLEDLEMRDAVARCEALKGPYRGGRVRRDSLATSDTTKVPLTPEGLPPRGLQLYIVGPFRPKISS